MVSKRTGNHSLNKPYGCNVSKPQTSTPSSPANTPTTTRLASGGLKHGREGQPSVNINNPPDHGTAYGNRRTTNKFGRDKRDRSRASPNKDYHDATRRHPQSAGDCASQFREARRPSPEVID